MNYSEENFNSLREKMVLEQLLARDIKDKKVLDVFGKVPRHRFVPPQMYPNAYSDFPLSIGQRQTISQPYIVALMVQLLDVSKTDKILEIGTGSGYETAILAELAEKVFTVERIKILGERAMDTLKELRYDNISINIGDGTLGWQDFAPYEKIIVTASSSTVPQPLLDQLKENGRLVIPVGSRFSQNLMLIEKVNGEVFRKDICGCVFVPLIGEYGYK